MIDRLEIQPGDRVLLLSIPDPSLVRDLSARVWRGVLVGIGDEEEIRVARRAHADLDNVMFHATSPAEIPWQDEFFCCVIDLRGQWADPPRVCREIGRLLACGGRAWLSHVELTPLVDAGMQIVESSAGTHLLRKNPTSSLNASSAL